MSCLKIDLCNLNFSEINMEEILPSSISGSTPMKSKNEIFLERQRKLTCTTDDLEDERKERILERSNQPGKPSKTFVQFWLYEEDPERARQVNPHPEWKGGKWMMFFESPNIDKKWEKAVILYRQGTLFRNWCLEDFN